MVTAKQRVLNAIDHRITDRIPITFDAEPEVYDALARHLRTKSKEELFDRLNVDTWMILPRNFIYPASEENKTIKTALWGYRTKTVDYGRGTYDELCFSPLAGKNEIDDIKNQSWPAEDTRHRAMTRGRGCCCCFFLGMADLPGCCGPRSGSLLPAWSGAVGIASGSRVAFMRKGSWA